jgi:hypothetical protein
MMNEVKIIKSETWTKSDISEQEELLNDTIEEYISDHAKIINIQIVEKNGLERFWIYVTYR